ncbi:MULTISPECIES: HAD family hydrolase [unclassified Paludibacterium]|uniref:HAD family hydrolase n=1 Tax=unclassified Paludibacterium TaxID=2618429 RepID=UPI001C0465A2|nr:HAD family hydrolase [Paludibacterium sp. B53371]BEV72314.1 HAD family hydrolase [Paludibacterium sp. THUN1379]
MQRQTDFSLWANALLFDMDGTLVDSSAVVEKVWHGFAARHGLDAAAVMARIPGRKAEESVALLAPPGVDVAAEAARLTAEEVADTEGIVALPGAARLLAALPDHAWALVTSAPRVLAEARMRAAGLPLPAVMICGEEVERGKPDPEGYLKAAQRLKVAPADCVVFEDAPAGLQAGLAAGMQVVALAGTLPSAQLADFCWLTDYRDLQLQQQNGRFCLSRTRPLVQVEPVMATRLRQST